MLGEDFLQITHMQQRQDGDAHGAGDGNGQVGAHPLGPLPLEQGAEDGGEEQQGDADSDGNQRGLLLGGEGLGLFHFGGSILLDLPALADDEHDDKNQDAHNRQERGIAPDNVDAQVFHGQAGVHGAHGGPGQEGADHGAAPQGSDNQQGMESGGNCEAPSQRRDDVIRLGQTEIAIGAGNDDGDAHDGNGQRPLGVTEGVYDLQAQSLQGAVGTGKGVEDDGHGIVPEQGRGEHLDIVGRLAAQVRPGDDETKDNTDKADVDLELGSDDHRENEACEEDQYVHNSLPFTLFFHFSLSVVLLIIFSKKPGVKAARLYLLHKPLTQMPNFLPPISFFPNPLDSV